MGAMSRRGWGAVLAVAGLLRVAFFVLSVTHVTPTADEAMAALQAKQIRHGHFPLLFMAQPYLFPLESYWMAPLSGTVARNAFGARYLAAVAWAVSAVGSLAILSRLFGAARAWPAMLLVLFPPAYVFVHQAGVALPGYWSMAALSSLVVLLASMIGGRARADLGLATVAGFLCGLAFAAQPLSLAITAPVALVVALERDARRGARAMLGFIPGALVGLVPFWIARWRFHENPDVSGSRPIAELASALVGPTVRQALLHAIGVTPKSFPDGGAVVAPFGAALDPFVLWGFVALLAAVVVARLAAFVRASAEARWPRLEPEDIFPAAAILNLVFVAASRRAHPGSPRYLLPLAWTLPFLVASIVARLRGRTFSAAAAACAAVALLNLATTAAVARKWLEPRFAWSIGNFDLRPGIDYLREHAIDRCYASFWEAYRIDFQTGEKILCSQPWNERFPGFPLPYKAAVDASRRVAYFLTPYGWFKPAHFEDDLARMEVSYQKAERGDFVLYHDFRCDRCAREVRLDAWRVASSEPGDFAAAGDRPGRWVSRTLQERGMTLELALDAPAPLERISIRYAGAELYGRPWGLRVSIHGAEGWRTVSKSERTDLDPFEMVNGHPTYDSGYSRQTLRFPAAMADAVRIEITEPNRLAPWIIDGIELYREAAA